MITINESTMKIISEIIRRGNVAEVKKEKDNVVVIEIQRKVKIKAPTTG